MRIMLDTNILLALEDYKIIKDELSNFYRYATSTSVEMMCLGTKPPERRSIILSKLGKYEVLPNPVQLTSDFIQLVGQKNQNDRIDNQQLLRNTDNHS